MRLLGTNTGHFVEKDLKFTKYAILSHTWDKAGEQTYKELRKIQKRYGPYHRLSTTPPPAPHHPLNPSTSPMSPIPPATTANERTPLLPPHRLSLLEQGIFQSSKAHSESRFTHMKRLMHHVLKRMWEFLILLLGLVLPQHWIQEVPSSSLHNGLSSTLHSNSGSRAPDHVGELSLSDPPEPTPSRSIWDDPELSPKIRRACEVARADGYEYIWIDSCCIDKSSSSELSEAINSMYAWYGGAHVCYAYLADVPAGDNHRGRTSWFRESRWFRRGWTLQELIAPLHLMFLSQDWAVIGPKYALVGIVQEITGISDEALLHITSLDQFSVAQRLSWASIRVTTRVEDLAYSLLGIFDINMPTLYGEGERALRRLQEQIMQRIPDQSLFAGGKYSPVATSDTTPLPYYSSQTLAMLFVPRDSQQNCAVQAQPQTIHQLTGFYFTVMGALSPSSSSIS
ncbi:hypothetical protein V8D89_001031 [Ganoderma adspersum]